MYATGSEQVFRFDATRQEDRVTICLWGELDVANSMRLREAFLTLDDTDAHELVVDLSEVWFIDSACLAVLVAAANRCRDHGRRLVLRAPTRSVLCALAASGLIRTFHYDPTTLDSAKPWPTRLPAQATVRRHRPQVRAAGAR